MKSRNWTRNQKIMRNVMNKINYLKKIVASFFLIIEKIASEKLRFRSTDFNRDLVTVAPPARVLNTNLGAICDSVFWDILLYPQVPSFYMSWGFTFKLLLMYWGKQNCIKGIKFQNCHFQCEVQGVNYRPEF